MTGEEVAAERCEALASERPCLERYRSRAAALGSLPIERALPIRQRRLVGPWCFLDRFGPLAFESGRPMDVAPHPHIGLQTVTWLLEGEVAHDDSLGCEAVARPGAVNVMTAGNGIAHAEWTPERHSGRLSGVQLWVALPAAERAGPASFQHVPAVPAAEPTGGLLRVFAGALAGVRSPARHASPLVGADLTVHPGARLALELDPTHEHALLLLEGEGALEGEPLEPSALHYLGAGRAELPLTSERGVRALLIGGPPFPEPILMWWNFVAATPEEIAAARADWEARRRFGEVRRYDGPRLEAPPLHRLARPNPAS